MNSDAQSEESTDIPICIICGQAAVGLGPFSRSHLCQQHLSIDMADAQKLKEDVAEELGTYSQGELMTEADELQEQLRGIQQTFVSMQRELLALCSRLTTRVQTRLGAVRVCQRDLEDVENYNQEVATAEGADDMAEVVRLAESMQLSLPNLKADFESAEQLRVETGCADLHLHLRRIRQLERLVSGEAGAHTKDAATETTSDFGTSVPATQDSFQSSNSCLFVKTHELSANGWVHWLASCSDTSGFFSDRSGRVVPAKWAGDGCEALAQPCIFAVLSDKEYLIVMSLDGSRNLRCHCPINWRKLIWGLHCDRQQLFIAQPDAVTVADLSGRVRFYIRPEIDNFGDIWGIGGNEASVFVSSGNKIAAFSKLQMELQFIISLSALPDADLYNMTCLDNCILVADKRHNKVHRVHIGTQQLVASYPDKNSCSVSQFGYPYDVAVDSRGRLFVSEFRTHSVRAVAADDGSLLWTLGAPGDNGSGDGRLCCPCGLAVVTGGSREQLVVADRNNKRLLVFDLDDEVQV